jgi:hypothetical protein
MPKYYCKGVCVKLDVGRGRDPYNEGKRRCGTCEIYTLFPSVYCPCCGRRFSYRPSCMRRSKRRVLELTRVRY